MWCNIIHRLKYLRSTTLGCRDIGIRKSEFVSKTQLLSVCKGVCTIISHEPLRNCLKYRFRKPQVKYSLSLHWENKGKAGFQSYRVTHKAWDFKDEYTELFDWIHCSLSSQFICYKLILWDQVKLNLQIFILNIFLGL